MLLKSSFTVFLLYYSFQVSDLECYSFVCKFKQNCVYNRHIFDSSLFTFPLDAPSTTLCNEMLTGK